MFDAENQRSTEGVPDYRQGCSNSLSGCFVLRPRLYSQAPSAVIFDAVTVLFFFFATKCRIFSLYLHLI